ncbi:hypothetical protein [Quadrisphaera sp. KR29]|uniref:hypothetical protein n=1 Tax=Quadrisphaera sp. KR29 TaxID=3461391 RepID=UPI004043B854
MLRRGRHLLSAAVAAALAAGTLLAGVVVAPAASAATTPALELLAQLPVREQSAPAPYEPGQFPFPDDAGGSTCPSAYMALYAQSEVLPTRDENFGCLLAKGRWTPFYTGGAVRTYTDPRELGVVQTVLPAEAWRSGAQGWSPARRIAFANVLNFTPSLQVAPLDQVRSKLATDPDAWGPPPGTGSACRYAVEWTQVKYRWSLSVDRAEHDRLQRWLATCRGAAVQVPVVVGVGIYDHVDPPGDGSPAGTDRMTHGQSLAAGEWLMSPNRQYGMTLQGDGNLVVYGPGRRALWASDTYGNPGATFRLADDREMLITSRDGRVLWRSGGGGNGAETLRLQDDGNAVLYRLDGSAAWYSGWDRTGLRGGEALLPGQRVTSANGRYFLTLQADGNAVVYTAGGRPVWFNGRYGTERLTFQPDGNLVAYRGSYPRALWSTDTWRAGPSRLVVQDDGNVVVYRGDNGRAVWYSGWDTSRWASSPSDGRTVRGDGLA